MFLPVIPRERKWHDRTTIVQWPLFPGYLFVRLRDAAISGALSTPGVLTIVRHNGSPAPIRDKVIQDVRLLTEVAAETGTLPQPTSRLHTGQHVRVVSGLLKGIEGTVVERRGGGRVLFEIGVAVIGQGLKVEVDSSHLRGIDTEGSGSESLH